MTFGFILPTPAPGQGQQIAPTSRSMAVPFPSTEKGISEQVSIQKGMKSGNILPPSLPQVNELMVYSITGAFAGSLAVKENRIDLKGLEPGLYYLVVDSGRLSAGNILVIFQMIPGMHNSFCKSNDSEPVEEEKGQ